MRILKIDSQDFNIWRVQIAKLINDSAKLNFPDYSIDKDYGINRCEELSGYLSENKAIVFVAVDGDVLAGWIWIHPISRLSEKRIHIAEIAIKKIYRNQGIGRALLNHAEKYAASDGFKEIDLLVTKSNELAFNFYEKADYEIERYLLRKKI